MNLSTSIKYLLASLLLFAACRGPYDALREAPGLSPGCADRFKPAPGTFWYKTDVEVVGNRLSGLLVFKTMPDSSRRVVFTSETGPTLFDFEFGANGFRVHYCQKKLNRKAVVRTLRKDFELLLQENTGKPGPTVLRDSAQLYFPFLAGKETNYYITDPGCDKLLRIEQAGRRKKKVVIGVFGGQSGMPDSVRIEHQTFDFSIQMQRIQRKTGE